MGCVVPFSRPTRRACEAPGPLRRPETALSAAQQDALHELTWRFIDNAMILATLCATGQIDRHGADTEEERMVTDFLVSAAFAFTHPDPTQPPADGETRTPAPENRCPTLDEARNGAIGEGVDKREIAIANTALDDVVMRLHRGLLSRGGAA